MRSRSIETVSIGDAIVGEAQGISEFSDEDLGGRRDDVGGKNLNFKFETLEKPEALNLQTSLAADAVEAAGRGTVGVLEDEDIAGAGHGWRKGNPGGIIEGIFVLDRVIQALDAGELYGGCIP